MTQMALLDERIVKDDEATAVGATTAVAIDRRLAVTLRAARATDAWGKLQPINAMPRQAPVPARRPVDVLV